jgi:hypothetical protein
VEFGDAYQCPDMLAILLYEYPQSSHLASQGFDFPGVSLLAFGEPFLRFGDLWKPLAVFAVVIPVDSVECVQMAGDSFQAFVDGHRILMFPYQGRLPIALAPLGGRAASPRRAGRGWRQLCHEEMPGIRVIRQGWLAPGPDPETYAFVRSEFV